MIDNLRQPLYRWGCLMFFLFICNSLIAEKAYDLPLRFVARADTHRLYYNYYSVRECLDIYNDDNLKPLVVTGVTASTWRGHKKDVMDDDWFAERRPVTIQPGAVYRIVERKRVVIGMFKRDWWVRWLKFKVVTNRGEFESNFVASPFKKPGELRNEIHQSHIDTLSEPQGLTPFQKKLPSP